VSDPTDYTSGYLQNVLLAETFDITKQSGKNLVETAYVVAGVEKEAQIPLLDTTTLIFELIKQSGKNLLEYAGITGYENFSNPEWSQADPAGKVHVAGNKINWTELTRGEWSQADPAGKVHVAGNKINWTELTRGDTKTQNTRDFGVGGLGTKWRYFFETGFTECEAGDGSSQIYNYHFALSNFATATSFPHITIRGRQASDGTDDAHFTFRVNSDPGGDQQFDTSIDLDVGTRYYCEFVRDGVTITLYIRTGSHDGTLIDTVTTTHASYPDVHRYIHLPMKVASGDDPTDWSTGYIENVLLQPTLDVVTKDVITTFTETLAQTDSIIKETQKAVSETINLVDNILRSTTNFRTISESATLTDTLTKQTIVTYIENAILTESITKTASSIRTLNESVNLSDTLIIYLIHILTESLTLADTITQDRTWFRTLNELGTLTTAFLKDWTLARTYTETLTLIDSITPIIVEILNLNETINLADSAILTNTWFRTLSESGALTDTLLKTFIILKTYTETLTLTDIVDPLILQIQTMIETIGLTDTAILGPGMVLLENSILIDALQKELALFKTYSETITGSDTITFIKTLVRVWTESLTLTDTAIRGGDFSQILTETATLVDSVIALTGFIIALTETMILVDLIAFGYGPVLEETVNLADTVAPLMTLFRTYSETITLITSVGRSFSVDLPESLIITDTIIRDTIYIINENSTLTDTISKAFVRVPFSDALTLVDTVAKRPQIPLIDTTTLVDTYLIRRGKLLTEVATLADSITLLKQLNRIFAETPALLDSLLRELAFFRTYTDNVRLRDVTSPGWDYIQNFVETLTLSAVLGAGIAEQLFMGKAIIFLMKRKAILSVQRKMEDIRLLRKEAVLKWGE
jgi:hypothetical protein